MIALQVLFYAFVVSAVAMWIVSVVSVIRMSRHRVPGISTLYLLTHGMAFFSGKNFTPEAGPHLRRFRMAAGMFFLLVVVAIVVAFFAFELHVEPAQQ